MDEALRLGMNEESIRSMHPSNEGEVRNPEYTHGPTDFFLIQCFETDLIQLPAAGRFLAGSLRWR